MRKAAHQKGANNRKQHVIVGGNVSMFADVEFSISKGTVLCSLLFLIRIKQLTTLCKLKILALSR